MSAAIRNIIIVIILAFIGVIVIYCANDFQIQDTNNKNITNIENNEQKNINDSNLYNNHINTQHTNDNESNIESQNYKEKDINNQDNINNHMVEDSIHVEAINKQNNNTNVNEFIESNSNKDNKTDSKNKESNANKDQNKYNTNTQSNKDNKTTDSKNKESNLNSNKDNKTDSKNKESNANKDQNKYNTNTQSNKDNKTTDSKNKESNVNKNENKYNTNTQSNKDQNKEINKYNVSDIEEKDKCIIAPTCDNSIMSKRLAATSLDIHAKVRIKEEIKSNGEKAGNEFLKLWRQTRNTILPKLTSHISNIEQQYISNNKKERICKANYYTEVLQDFGHGWKDKKGDKSPIYSVVYKISCNDSKESKLSIIEERLSNPKSNNMPIPLQRDSFREPPACNVREVYNKISETSFYFHANKRAEEEGYIRGEKAKRKFESLWEDTKPQIISKLSSHISNIQDRGLMTNKQVRMCVANYYTEVLQDFGHGWKDKKGDKSPKYIVFYTISYVNNNSDEIIIKITAQNRTRN